MTVPAAGFRVRDHTADTLVEAWAPTRADCLRQAVLGLVATFAEPDDVGVTAQVTVRLPDRDDDALVTLLEEVVYRLDAEDTVPVDAEVAQRPGQAAVATLHLARLSAVRVAGAAPKAIAWSDLLLARTDDAWRCRFIVDV